MTISGVSAQSIIYGTSGSTQPPDQATFNEYMDSSGGNSAVGAVQTQVLSIAATGQVVEYRVTGGVANSDGSDAAYSIAGTGRQGETVGDFMADVNNGEADLTGAAASAAGSGPGWLSQALGNLFGGIANDSQGAVMDASGTENSTAGSADFDESMNVMNLALGADSGDAAASANAGAYTQNGSNSNWNWNSAMSQLQQDFSDTNALTMGAPMSILA